MQNGMKVEVGTDSVIIYHKGVLTHLIQLYYFA